MRIILWLCSFVCAIAAKRSFTIDYKNHTFLKDGKPFTYYAGEIHYFRVRPELWEDRLQRIRAAGLNAVQIYAAWNWHETFEGKIDFERPEANIFKFIKLAEKQGLYVILRAGPYACAEWEYGGLPYWLLNKPGIKLRVYNKPYLAAVYNFYKVFLPKVRPLLYIEGGPILSVQIENEYGSYSGCDNKYLEFLRDMFHTFLGPDVLLFTTDGAGYSFLKCGIVDGVFPTVDFGPGDAATVAHYFDIQQNVSKGGAVVNSEFYPGWFTLWGGGNPDLPSTSAVINTMTAMHNHGASFSFYMFHGGTNFGFWNGAETAGAVITSYDYGAPITENGGITPRYLEIRKWITDKWNVTLPPVPRNNTIRAYGKLKLRHPKHLGDAFKAASERCKLTDEPLSFEELDHPYGFVVYTTKLRINGTKLDLPNLKDHGYVFVDNVFQGVVVDNLDKYSKLSIDLKNVNIGSKLQIIVENRGRLTYETIIDRKGLLPDVHLDGKKLTKWMNCPVDITNEAKLLSGFDNAAFNISHGNGIYFGQFDIHGEIADTWLNPKGFRKGQVIINEFNLGRYWTSAGPQITLYVPAPLLRRRNSIILIELLGQENGPCIEENTIEFTDNVVGVAEHAAHLSLC